MASSSVVSVDTAPSIVVDPIDELIVRARKGDRNAFGAIYERHFNELYWHALRLTGDPNDAADVTQEAFARALVALPKTAGAMNVRAWLYRIVTNACHDLGRQCARSATTNLSPEIAAAIPDHDATTDPERWLLRREAQSEVSGALGRMSNRSRTLLLLRERDELSCAEIGERLGASRAAVKSGLFRARHELRRLYDAERDAA